MQRINKRPDVTFIQIQTYSNVSETFQITKRVHKIVYFGTCIKINEEIMNIS